jgi:hypothetical protein
MRESLIPIREFQLDQGKELREQHGGMVRMNG